MAKPKLLIADDDPDARRMLRFHLEGGGFDVREANDGAAAINMMSDEYDAALFDLQMPGATGLECLKIAERRMPGVPVLVISAFGQIEDAVDAMREGAFDYVRKPFAPDELLARLREAVRIRSLVRENRELRGSLGETAVEFGYVAADDSSKRLLDHARRLASLDATVLLTGPSGTGKSKLARVIHQLGRGGAGGPLVCVSCAALPRELIEAELFGCEPNALAGAKQPRIGRIEQAHNGTLVLDEVGDMPLDLQPKLLAFLQDRTINRLGGGDERHVDARVIAATNADLDDAVGRGAFREDLFYRLNVVRLRVPPLTERRADILPLAEAVLERIARRRDADPPGLTDAAQRALERHLWRGNVRELENTLERASVFCDKPTLDVADLTLEAGSPTRTPATAHSRAPENVDGRSTGASPGERVAVVETPESTLAGLTLAELERKAILETLAACDGNRSRAAQMLGVSEKTIYNKINLYDLKGQV